MVTAKRTDCSFSESSLAFTLMAVVYVGLVIVALSLLATLGRAGGVPHGCEKGAVGNGVQEGLWGKGMQEGLWGKEWGAGGARKGCRRDSGERDAGTRL